MSRIRTSITAMLATAVVATAFATQAGAKDWTDSFPSGADVPAALGKYGAKPDASADAATKGGWYPCAAFTAPSSKTIVYASYASKATTPKALEVRAYVYPSNTKAEQAFATIQKRLSQCNGKKDATFSESGPNTMRTTTTTGTLPELSVTSVPSLYVYNRTVPIPGAGNAAQDNAGSMNVITLVNDTILMTTAGQVGKPGYTAKGKAAIVDFASDVVTSWTVAND